MVLKATSIHTNFLRNGEQYVTGDAAEAAAPVESPNAVDVSPQRPSQSRRNSLWGRKSREQPRKQVEMPEGAQDENIILVVWDGPNDPENPMNWSISRKWLTTALLCSMCLFIGLATAAFSTGIGPMSKELGVSTEVGQVGMLLFNGAFAVVPLFLGPLSEFVGRNPIYLGCYAFFTVWFIPLALAQNIQTVLVARFLSGAFGAAGTTIIPGTLADIWKTKPSCCAILPCRCRRYGWCALVLRLHSPGKGVAMDPMGSAHRQRCRRYSRVLASSGNSRLGHSGPSS